MNEQQKFAVARITGQIDAMVQPKQASQEEAIEIYEEIVAHCEARIEVIKDDLNRG